MKINACQNTGIDYEDLPYGPIDFPATRMNTPILEFGPGWRYID